MILTNLELRNFRNYREQVVEPAPGLNLLVGGNGQGKTNLLEAIYLFSTGRSHRTHRDAPLVRFDSSWYDLRAEVTGVHGELSLRITYEVDKGKRVYINGSPQERVSDLLGVLSSVQFSPEDLVLVKGPPAARRSYLDSMLSQASKTYYHYLSEYSRVLAQRNQVLKGINRQPSLKYTLEVWDSKLIESGSQLMTRRAEAVDNLSSYILKSHSRIAPGSVGFEYRPSLGEGTDGGSTPGRLSEWEEAYEKVVEKNRTTEITRGITLQGPHRDDIHITLGGNEARLYASQGQQRTISLALRMAELGFIEDAIDDRPLLLLDDVFSELDEGRRSSLLELLSDSYQTILTLTDLDGLPEEIIPQEGKWLVENGTLREVAP